MMKASFQEVRFRDSFSFLGTQKWKVKECLQELSLLPKVLPGRGELGGVLWP